MSSALKEVLAMLDTLSEEDLKFVLKYITEKLEKMDASTSTDLPKAESISEDREDRS